MQKWKSFCGKPFYKDGQGEVSYKPWADYGATYIIKNIETKKKIRAIINSNALFDTLLLVLAVLGEVYGYSIFPTVVLIYVFKSFLAYKKIESFPGVAKFVSWKAAALQKLQKTPMLLLYLILFFLILLMFALFYEIFMLFRLSKPLPYLDCVGEFLFYAFNMWFVIQLIRLKSKVVQTSVSHETLSNN